MPDITVHFNLEVNNHAIQHKPSFSSEMLKHLINEWMMINS